MNATINDSRMTQEVRFVYVVKIWSFAWCHEFLCFGSFKISHPSYIFLVPINVHLCLSVSDCWMWSSFCVYANAQRSHECTFAKIIFKAKNVDGWKESNECCTPSGLYTSDFPSYLTGSDICFRHGCWEFGASKRIGTCVFARKHHTGK